VAVRYEIGECDAGGSVKQLFAEPQVVEHIRRRLMIRVMIVRV
jgi:hypothetical protein